MSMRKMVGCQRPAAGRDSGNQSRRKWHADFRRRAAQSGRHGLGTANQCLYGRSSTSAICFGDELVPDYFTSVKRRRLLRLAFSYFGQNEDPRKKAERPDLVAKAIKPDYAVGSHVAALGLAFYRDKAFPRRYHGGAFIGMHGSWNRSKLVGYKVAFFPSKMANQPALWKISSPDLSPMRSKFEAYGRPVGVMELADGSLLVADDSGGKLWRITSKGGNMEAQLSNGTCYPSSRFCECSSSRAFRRRMLPQLAGIWRAFPSLRGSFTALLSQWTVPQIKLV